MNKRFSILALMTLTLVVAAVVAGFRYGARTGHEQGEQEWELQTPLSMRHSLNAVKFSEEIDSWDWPHGEDSQRRANLVRMMIQERIAPGDWEAMGGPFSMSYMAPSNELSVFASKSIQNEIAALLERLTNDSEQLTAYAKATLSEQVKTEKRQREWVLEQLAPAQELIPGTITLPASGEIVAGTYAVLHSKAVSPKIDYIEFSPNTEGWVVHGGAKLYYADGDKHPPDAKAFQISGRGRMTIGTTSYSWGKVDDVHVLVSNTDPKQILTLSGRASESGEAPDPPDQR